MGTLTDEVIVPYGKTRKLGWILSRQGTMEILLLLNDRPRRYTELKNGTNLSDPTLTRYLTKLIELKIISKRPLTPDEKKRHIYSLASWGKEALKFSNRFEKMLAKEVVAQTLEEFAEEGTGRKNKERKGR